MPELINYYVASDAFLIWILIGWKKVSIFIFIFISVKKLIESSLSLFFFVI